MPNKASIENLKKSCYNFCYAHRKHYTSRQMCYLRCMGKKLRELKRDPADSDTNIIDHFFTNDSERKNIRRD